MEVVKNNKLEVIKDVFERDDIKKRFFDMLGQKANGFIISVINIVSSNDQLKNADRDSILFAAATAASMDLPINPNLGFAYIVPYKTKVKETVIRDGKEIVQFNEKSLAQFQMGYKGFIQLAMRSGQFKTISATPIYEGQLIEENPLTGFKFDFSIKSEKVIGYAGYFELVNGFNKTLYMSIDEMNKHGERFSQSFKYDIKSNKTNSLWSTDFNSMAQKTVLKLLLSRYAPLSIEMQKAVLADQSVIQDWDSNNLDYVDNDTKPKSPKEVSEEKERERINQFIKDAKTSKELTDAMKYISSLDSEDELALFYYERFDELVKLEANTKDV
jgi:recombination protein RecT